MKIRLYSLCRIYAVTASLYYLWYLALFFLTPNFPAEINHIALFGVYWFLITILYFYFRYKYLISIRRFAVTGGWSFINVLSINWLLQGFHFYFYYISLFIIPFSIYEIARISFKMQNNIRGLDENGEEFEMDEDEYLKLMEKEENERRMNEEVKTEM